MSGISSMEPLRPLAPDVNDASSDDHLIALVGIAAVADLIYTALAHHTGDALDDGTIRNAAGVIRDLARGALA